MNYERMKALIQEYLLSFWVAAVACSLVVLLFLLNEYEPPGFYSVVETLVYVQKLSIGAVTLHNFSRYEETLPRALFVLGSYVFAIYFLHFFFVNVAVQGVLLVTRGDVNAYSAMAGGLLILVVAIISSRIRIALPAKANILVAVSVLRAVMLPRPEQGYRRL